MPLLAGCICIPYAVVAPYHNVYNFIFIANIKFIIKDFITVEESQVLNIS